ncbi:MAG: ceramidase domain-containing protein [Halocynthiibacter sp.]
MIDLYCERTAFGFWNEPLNAVSNLSFILAAYFAWRLLQRQKSGTFVEYILIALAASIGIGSFLFHTFATPWAELLDVVPIWSFVALFVLAIIYRSVDENIIRFARISAIAITITGLVFYFTSGDVTTSHTHAHAETAFNGSLQYAPAIIALGIFAGLSYIKKSPARHMIGLACVTFFVSLIARSIDLNICTTTPIGSHFIWHLLNGLMIYLLLRALIRYFPTPQKTAPL